MLDFQQAYFYDIFFEYEEYNELTKFAVWET